MQTIPKAFCSGILAAAIASPQLALSAECTVAGQQPPASQSPTTSSADKPNSPQAAPPGAKPAPSFAFGIEEGTRVSLTLARELSSATEAAGNRVDFDVAEDVKVNDVIVIPKGAKAWGTILNAKPKRRLGRAGQLDVRIDEVRLVDGERVALPASQESKGKGRSGVMTGGIIATGVLFFPAAPLFLFMHGKDVVIAKGAPVTAYVDQGTPLDRAKFSKATVTESNAAPATPAAAPATPPAPTPAPPVSQPRTS